MRETQKKRIVVAVDFARDLTESSQCACEICCARLRRAYLTAARRLGRTLRAAIEVEVCQYGTPDYGRVRLDPAYCVETWGELHARATFQPCAKSRKARATPGQ